jgi:hypothetical protein
MYGEMIVRGLEVFLERSYRLLVSEVGVHMERMDVFELL